MLVKVFGAAVQGIDATLITIEVNSSRGCMFYLVGLPDSAVKESYQRIRSAIQVNGYKMPTSSITINMAPADIRKEGTVYDMGIAVALLNSFGYLSCSNIDNMLFAGELSLDGHVNASLKTDFEKYRLSIVITCFNLLKQLTSYMRLYSLNTCDFGFVS